MEIFDFKNYINLNQDFLVKLGQVSIKALIIMAICLMVLKLTNKAIQTITKRQLNPSPLLLLGNSVLRWVVCIFGTLLILQQIGVTLNSIWTMISAIIAMVAIGFVALWSVLSNLLCTLMLIIFHPFRVGDEVEVIDPAMTSGLKGRVRNINMMFTSLSAKGDDPNEVFEIMVPNNLFFQKIIRCKKGRRTYSLDEQLFEEKSFLRAEHRDSRAEHK